MERSVLWLVWKNGNTKRAKFLQFRIVDTILNNFGAGLFTLFDLSNSRCD